MVIMSMIEVLNKPEYFSSNNHMGFPAVHAASSINL